MNKFKKFIYIAALAGAIGCLSGCSYEAKTSYMYDKADKYTAGDREIKDKIENIDIDYMSGDIELIATDTDSISIKETSNKVIDSDLQVHTWVDGTTLHVRFCESAKNLVINNLEKQLTIEIPEDLTANEIKFVMSSGDVTCDDIVADNFEVNTSSGDQNVDVVADTIKLSASSGGIKLTQKEESEKVSITTSSGTITADVDTVTEMDLSASSGRMEINGEDVKTFKADSSSGGGSYSFAKAPESTDIQASSGDVTIFIPEKSDLTAKLDHSSGDVSYEQAFSRDGDTYVCGSGTDTLNVQTSSGDIDIKALAE